MYVCLFYYFLPCPHSCVILALLCRCCVGVTSDKQLFWLMQISYCPAVTLDYLTFFFSLHPGVVQRGNLSPQSWGLFVGGGASPRGGGPDQLWPRGSGLGGVVGGAVHCQGGHQPRLPQRYTSSLVGGGCGLCVLVFIVCIENIILFISGTSWMMVDSPSPDVGAIHVAVGINVVWALTKDNKVRKFCTEHYKRHKKEKQQQLKPLPSTFLIKLLF